MSTTQKQPDPSQIMQIGMGFWASKTLLCAVNMGLFSLLSDKELSGNAIKVALGLHDRGLHDFLDTLVALGFLKRRGIKETSYYSNSEDTNLFLDKGKPTYIGGILEMANNRLYPFWSNLEDGLKTGTPQNETKAGGAPIFEAIYADEDKLREFLRAMAGIQMGNFIKLSQAFDFSGYQSLCDLGGAGGHLSMQVALNNEHINCITFDLPPVAPIAKENIAALGLNDRIAVESGDFFQTPIPKADVISMGNVLHDWGTEQKKVLIKKAYDALPEGGSLVVIENIIDNDRNQNAFGLMMSLNMLIETPEGYDFSEADFKVWAEEAGFKNIYSLPLTGPTSAVVAVK